LTLRAAFQKAFQDSRCGLGMFLGQTTKRGPQVTLQIAPVVAHVHVGQLRGSRVNQVVN
jgi:hypothetical protein